MEDLDRIIKFLKLIHIEADLSAEHEVALNHAISFLNKVSLFIRAMADIGRDFSCEIKDID